MRMAFLGKGGSGKTTLTTAFLQLLQERVHSVLAIDADVNVHAYYGRDLTTLIDPRFIYEQALTNQERSCIV